MKNAMTRKFIAAFLAFAMLLGAVQVFANPAGVRDPERDVYLYIHHVIGTLSTPVAEPGEWFAPDPPLEDRDLAQGTYWRALRVIPPAGWSHAAYVQPGPPTTPDQSATLPAAVMEHIRNAAQGGLADSAHPFPVTPPTPNNLVIASGPNAGTWSFGPMQQQVTNAQGRAIFPFGTNHGLYVAWEILNPNQNAVSPIHLTPDYALVRPFLVNLPWFRHQPVHPDATPQPTPIPGHSPTPGVPAYPGQWLYRVHVFPKTPPDIFTGTEGKTITTISLGADATSEYAIVNWQIILPVGDDLYTLLPVPEANLARGDGSASGFAATNPTHILIQDVLNTRLQLLPASYVPNPTSISPVPTALTGAHTTAGLAGNAHWLSVYFSPCLDHGTLANAVPFPRGDGPTANWTVTTNTRIAPATLPYPHGTTVAGPPPVFTPDVAAPALTGVQAPGGNQVFWAHFSRNGIQHLATDPAFRPAAGQPYAGEFVGGRIIINFRTRIRLTDADINPITNQFEFNYGARPTDTIGTPPGGCPGDPSPTPRPEPEVVVNTLDVLKTNPNDTPLDGAIFFLFRCYQMSGDPGDANRVPAAGAIPYRIAISGGAAGSTLDVTPPPAFEGTVAEWNLVRETLALTVPGGVARFNNLPQSISTPRRDNWYLFEAMAPAGGYRRIEGYGRLQIVASCSVHANEAACLADPGDCVMHANQVNLVFTNTRDFQLPMTGGLGTFMFTAGGVSLMGIAGLFLFLARKKDKTKEVRTQ